MTLHWWMHWFWITYHICVCYCNPVTSPMHSLPSEVHGEMTKMPSLNRSVKPDGNSSYIPPITAAFASEFLNATTVIPTKLHKSSKKLELHANLTNKSSVTTEHPLVKETTVIDQNVTEAGLSITDNQTFINTSFNAINRAENLSYISDDNATNQSIIVNSERVGVENQDNAKGSLTAAGITGITLGCVSIIGVICAVSFIMYRNYGFNRPQVLNDRCSNPDSSGYIDDSTVRENSEEMYSLDNDSFLNSLEAMTIQNLWTDTVKHTKL